MNRALRIRHPSRNSALGAPRARIRKLSLDQREWKILRRDLFLVGEHAPARDPCVAFAIAEQARKLEHVILLGSSLDAAEKLVSRLRKWLAPMGNVVYILPR